MHIINRQSKALWEASYAMIHSLGKDTVGGREGVRELNIRPAILLAQAALRLNYLAHHQSAKYGALGSVACCHSLYLEGYGKRKRGLERAQY